MTASSVPTTLATAWQAALAAEQQAAFGYALLGPWLSDAQQPFARTCATAHETARTDTTDALVAAGLTPVAGQADYRALYPVDTVVRAQRLAISLEQSGATAWRYLYSVAAGLTGRVAESCRTQAQAQLTASAVRAVRWRRLAGVTPASVPFPGV